MKEYLKERHIRERNSRISGIILTLAGHAAAFVAVSFSGLSYIYPPPEETSMLIDFEQEEVQQTERGREPKSEEVDLTRPVELVQRNESPAVRTAENLTPRTAQDDFGDVETPAPQQETKPALDPRAAFPGMGKKDTTLTAEHSADKPSPTFKAGQPTGNATNGRTDDRPNAHLEGRSVDKAGLKKPAYSIQESGTVVVTIWVDQYGNVTKAQPGDAGTTTTNSALWAAARKAAMETHFNQSADAPPLQKGTITYNFILK